MTTLAEAYQLVATASQTGSIVRLSKTVRATVVDETGAKVAEFPSNCTAINAIALAKKETAK